MSKRYHRAVLVSCEVPWDEDQRFMEDIFRAEVRATLRSFDNLYIFGTAGEGYAVTESQFRDVVQVFREETDRKGVHPMVGVIAMSTAQTVERIGIAHDAGFRIFQICLPSWRTVTDEEYMVFFTEVCGAFPDSRFLHYNVGMAGRVLGADDYLRIEEAVPNLVATKTGSASPEDIEELVTRTSLQHFVGETAFARGSRFGECSILSSGGILFPERVNELLILGASGRVDEAECLAAEISRAALTFFRPASESTPLGFEARVHGAWDKMFKRAAGLEMPFTMLSPYRHWDDEIYEACLQALRAEFGDWLR